MEERRPSSVISRAIEIVSSGQRPAAERMEVRVEKTFDVLPTHLQDIFILAEHGNHPDPTRTQTEGLQETSRIYFVNDAVIKALQDLQKPYTENL